MKKKILFVLPTLQSGGGVISGLKNMLSLLPKGIYDIDVLPLGYSDNNNVHLNNCNVLQDTFILTATDGVYEHSVNYRFKKSLWICKVLLALLHKIKLRSFVVNYLYQLVAKKYQGYDVVVGYQEGAATQFVQYINSPLRIAWIHCDYAKYYALHKCRSEEMMYSKFNKIVCVSKFTLNNFISIYPLLKERSIYIYNLLDIPTIQCNSNKTCDCLSYDHDIVNIVSIGRINPVKQFHLIPKIISQMLNNGVSNFRWILIGGVDSNALKQLNEEIEKFGVTEKYFKYIGPQYNPYPYIKNSDILVSTSSSEACPFVVNEARVLGVPVVSNNYPSIYEFINDGINGRICTIDDMPQILTVLINDQEALNMLKQGMKTDKYNNDPIVEQICNLYNL